MKREQFISFFFIGVLAFIIYEVFCIFAPFFTAIFWAAILAFASYPLYEKLRKLFPKRSNLIEKGYVQAGKFSWSRMAQQTLEVYEKALQRPQR